MAAEDRVREAPENAWSVGDAVFLGNPVLGKFALLHDDVETAEKHLHLSAQIKDEQVTFWGPNTTLARELLKRNRSKMVLQFLEEAKRFWRPERDGPKTADKRLGASGQLVSSCPGESEEHGPARKQADEEAWGSEEILKRQTG